MERTIRDIRLRFTWKQYESAAKKLLAEYARLNEAQRLFKPSAAEWSIAQVFFHLDTMQELSRISMENRIKSGKAKRAGLKHSWRYIRLITALALPLKYRVPQAGAATISDTIVHDVYPERWKQSLVTMEEFLSVLPDSQKNNLLFMHPLAGPLPVCLTIGFLRAHLKHHKRQLKRIRRSPGFPVHDLRVPGN